MRKLAVSLIALVATTAAAQVASFADAPIVNPAIDPAAFLRVAGEAIAHRDSHRLSEADFT
jgi:hypothetical protein